MSGSIADNAGRASGVIAAAAGGGKLLQVLQSIKNDTATTSSTSFEAVSGLSVSITPSATDSKILVLWNLNGMGNTGGSSIQILRDSTELCIGDADGSRVRVTGCIYAADTNTFENVAGQFLDEDHGSTSALSYAVHWRTHGAANYMNRCNSDPDSADGPRTASTITVMEIGA